MSADYSADFRTDRETVDALKQIEEPIARIISKFDHDKKAIEAFDGIIDVLSEHPTLLWKSVAQAKFMGVHRGNRGGLGVSVQDALNNGCKHVKAGYSYRKANEGNFAIEM
eukprot:9473135-Pyramimonas_sp.AAC.1